ncbi:MAG TPA: S53 family peptidase [Bryobacteraceae bacterium]|nr:S53 family peptidase [Bryobacteraceae bacterium]
MIVTIKSSRWICSTVFPFLAVAQSMYGQAARTLITEPINNARLVTFLANTRPEANAQNDRGRVADDFPMSHLQLVLQRSPERAQAAADFVDELYNPNSPNYHKWLTTEQIADRFGASDQDIATLTSWLETNGFTVDGVLPTKLEIEFSGTAGNVRAAFHTNIHRLLVNGESHYANMSDPQVPSAIAAGVAGVLFLHDFEPRPLTRKRMAAPDFRSSTGRNLVTPSDLDVIYNLSPAFAAGLTGLNQTIYVAESGDIFSLNDWNVFRKVMGLARPYPHATLTQIHPAGGATCTDPGVNGAADEVALDVEYSSAAAPNAAIVISACRSLLAAIENPINSPTTPAAVMSISYGEAEALNGAASNLAFMTTYQTGAMKGWSIFVSSGDESAASADANRTNATHGIGISGLTSTPYNTSVGGTDFATTYLNNVSTYWSSTNSPTLGNALSYVPEIPWDDSCANSLFATFNGFASTFGPASYCNSLHTTNPGSNRITTASGSGGPSGCATGAPTTSGVVSGTCAGYAKPAWQTAFGVPADGVRDIPDISLFAANGPWGYYYPACISQGTSSCLGTIDTWPGFGGTSISSPIMAGITALINQRLGGPQGLINPELYSLASAEYGSSGSASCNSTNGNTVGSNCIFYDVTLGDIVVNCTGALNCYFGGVPVDNTNFYGVLSTSNSTFSPAYPATVGFDLATGIGTVNAYNLIVKFGTSPTVAPASAAVHK